MRISIFVIYMISQEISIGVYVFVSSGNIIEISSIYASYIVSKICGLYLSALEAFIQMC